MKKKILAVALSTLMVCTMTAVLYACGDENTDTYTVTYAKSEQGENGTLPTDENEYKQGDKVTLKPANLLTLDGYHFMGWNDGTATYKVTDEYTMPAKDVTLKAVWQLDGYTVSYLNGREDRESMIVLEDEYQEGNEITLIAKPEGYTDENGRSFAGWYAIENQQVAYYNAGDTFTIPDHNVEFFAYWKATSITATFYLEQGIASAKYDTKVYEIGETITIVLPEKPADKTEGGDVYEFAGWYRNDNEDIPFTATTEITEQDKEYGAISLFAKWTKKTEGGETGDGDGDGEEKVYTVSYLSSSTKGEVLHTETYKAGETVTMWEKPEDLVDEKGREFVGWRFMNLEYKPGETFTMQPIDMHFVPIWDAGLEGKVKVNFYLDYDVYDDWDNIPVPVSEKTYDVTEAIVLPDPPKKEGFIFKGWDIATNRGTAFDENYQFSNFDVEDGIEVVGLWEPVSE